MKPCLIAVTECRLHPRRCRCTSVANREASRGQPGASKLRRQQTHAGGSSKRTGRDASQSRADLESGVVDADFALTGGKLPRCREEPTGAPGDSGGVAGSGEADKPANRGIGEGFRARESAAGVSGRRGVRGRTDAALSKAATRADRAGITALFEATDLRGTGGPDAGSATCDAACVSPGVPPIGEPDAANPHVRLDERGRETE